ncbi:MAG TPA: ester cyclase [Gemmatimonadales bacterium]|nr:ester cyclase [Gemmatimonadales bacterium]
MACAVAACQPQQAANTAMLEANKALQRQAFEAVAAGNFEALGQLVAPEYRYHGPDGGTLDWAGTRAMVEGYKTAFPDLRFSIAFQVAEGDLVAAYLTASGTNTGPMGETPATGKPVTVTGINIVRVANGKIVEEWENFDEAGMLRQLGATPN